MNMPRRSGRSRLARSLVILGAFLGMFALHSLSIDDVALSAPPTASAPLTAALEVDSHALSERLEQVAMLAPAMVSDTGGHHHVLPCVASVAGSLLLLAGLALRRRRFGDEPRRPAVTLAVLPPRVQIFAAPQLTKLCVLRT